MTPTTTPDPMALPIGWEWRAACDVAVGDTDQNGHVVREIERTRNGRLRFAYRHNPRAVSLMASRPATERTMWMCRDADDVRPHAVLRVDRIAPGDRLLVGGRITGMCMWAGGTDVTTEDGVTVTHADPATVLVVIGMTPEYHRARIRAAR